MQALLVLVLLFEMFGRAKAGCCIAPACRSRKPAASSRCAPLSISAAVGFIALAGVAVLDGLRSECPLLSARCRRSTAFNVACITPMSTHGGTVPSFGAFEGWLITNWENPMLPLEKTIEFRLRRHDDLLRMEFDLVGYRMTWLMTSQAFFFAGFALCIVTPLPPYPILVTTLMMAIPVIGAASSILVGRAIVAAHKEIDKLKDSRDELEKLAEPLGYEMLGVRSESAIHTQGNGPSFWLPWLLAFCWSVAFILVMRPLL